MKRFNQIPIKERTKTLERIQSNLVKVTAKGLLDQDEASIDKDKFFTNMTYLLQQDLEDIKVYLLYHLHEAMAEYSETTRYFRLSFWSGSESMRTFQEKIEEMDKAKNPKIEDFIKCMEAMFINGPGEWTPSSLKYIAFKKIITSILDPDYKRPVLKNEGTLLMGKFIQYSRFVLDYQAQLELAKFIKEPPLETPFAI